MIEKVKSLVKRYFDLDRENRFFFNSIAAISFGFLWAMFKLYVGYSTESVYLFMSAIYSLTFCCSRMFSVIGYSNKDAFSVKEGIVVANFALLFSASTYFIYALLLKAGEDPADYLLWQAAAMALVALYFIISGISNLIAHKDSTYLSGLSLSSVLASVSDLYFSVLSILKYFGREMSVRRGMITATSMGLVTLTFSGVHLAKGIHKSFE